MTEEAVVVAEETAAAAVGAFRAPTTAAGNIEGGKPYEEGELLAA